MDKGNLQGGDSPETTAQLVSHEESLTSETIPAVSSHMAGKTRLSERFQVPGAAVVCMCRSALLLWKQIGPPCHVNDMCVTGVSFLTFARNLRVNQPVRLALHLPDQMPLSIKGKVARLDKNPAGSGYVCGVKYTDYGQEAWAILCRAHAKHTSSVKVRFDMRPRRGQDHGSHESPALPGVSPAP